jgi:hypothetical protein
MTASEIRDRFFETAIPLNRGATSRCLSAGDAIVKWALAAGAPPRSFSRENLWFDSISRRSLRTLLSDLTAALESRPNTPLARNAVAKLEAYSQALT